MALCQQFKMADFNGTIVTADVTSSESTPQPIPTSIEDSVITISFLTPQPSPAEFTSGLGTNTLVYYKMRALRDPEGTGFVGWVVLNNPDPAGEQAPEAIVADSAVITASWII